MSKTYITKPGDTFSSISRAETGSERNAQLIKQVNPHATTPFSVGTSLQIPSPDVESDFKPYGLDVMIDGISIDVNDSFTLSSAIDGFSRLEFIIPNEIETRAIAPMLQPIAVDAGHNGVQMFSGYMESPIPESSGNKKLLKITASSWANLLASPPPITAFPLEFKDSKLDVISKVLIDSCMVQHSFYVDPGPVFKKVSMEQSGAILDFLSGLCRQRAYVMRDDEFGAVVFDNGDSLGAPIMKIEDGKRPDVTFSLKVNPAGWHSHVTGVLKSKRGKSKKKVVWQNPFYVGIMRPHEFEVSEIDEGELETAVNSVAARMFASVWGIEITVPEWIDKNGNLIKPGGLVEAMSPTNYIENFTELLIDSVTLNGSHESKSATMSCVIPGSYSGRIPESVPWK